MGRAGAGGRSSGTEAAAAEAAGKGGELRAAGRGGGGASPGAASEKGEPRTTPSSPRSAGAAVARPSRAAAAMHDAFEHVPILEKLPLQIDCLAAWGEPPPASRPETPPALLGSPSLGPLGCGGGAAAAGRPGVRGARPLRRRRKPVVCISSDFYFLNALRAWFGSSLCALVFSKCRDCGVGPVG